MNRREESKLKTRALILEKSKSLMTRMGVMGLTTAAIAGECGIAHGSIFQHFGDRETLVNTVLEEEIKRIAQDIESICIPNADLKGLLESYLEVMSLEEDFLGMVYRELPFLPEGVQRNMVALEAVLRNAFFMSLQDALRGRMDDRELTLRMDAFFSTVQRYLALKQLYSPGGKVMTTRAGDIRKLFEILFEGVYWI